jgi:3-deoxy-D-manno-octulosonic-acid transferase
MPASPLLTLYQAATALASLAMPWWLQRRVGRGKESASRWRERFGETTTAANPVDVWCHAASVGEAVSVLPLLRELAARGARIVLTTGTVTSEELVRDKLPSAVIHQFAPLDYNPWVSAFLNTWQPKLALRVDSELWPTTLQALTNRHIPVVQINARLSERAAHNWTRVPIFARSIFSRLSLVLAQSEADRQRFEQLGAANSVYRGNLKLDLPDLPFDAAELSAVKYRINGRPVWLAASIHPGEDTIIARAHAAIRLRFPDALMIVVPRHAERGAQMAHTLTTYGHIVAQRSARTAIDATHTAYIADTMGELGLFYRLAPIVFIGKTFAVGGGQNPAEPAQIGCSLLWGPDMSNFTEIADDLVARRAAECVAQPEQLGPAVIDLLSNEARTTAMSTAGRDYVHASRGALQRALADLAPYLEAASIR